MVKAITPDNVDYLIKLADMATNAFLKDREGLIRELRGVFERQKRAMIEEIRTLFRQMGSDTAVNNDYNVGHKIQTLTNIMQLLGNTNEEIRAFLSNEMKSLAQGSYRRYEQIYANFIDQPFGQINSRALQALSTMGVGADPKQTNNTRKGSGYNERLDTLEKYSRNEINRIIQHGFVQGESLKDMIDKVERVANMSQYASERIVRTYSNLARNIGQWSFMQDHKHVFTKWMWVASFSSTTCDECAAKHGTIHDADEVLVDHWNGHCEAVPIPNDFEGDDLLGDRTIRNPVTGEQETVDGKLSYIDWLQDAIKRGGNKDNEEAMRKHLDDILRKLK